MSTAVWVGTDDNSPIQNADDAPIYGRGVPGEIWQTFMNDAMRDERTEQFSDFRPIGTPPTTAPATPTPARRAPGVRGRGVLPGAGR